MTVTLRILDSTPAAPSGPWWRTALGFRPFFAASALLAPLWLLLWLVDYFRGGALVYPGLPALWWHAHEMLFGLMGAVVAGFLLTAVPNWTGLPAVRGPRLGALFGLWLAARLGMLLPLGPWMKGVSALDLAFFPALALLVAQPVVKARQGRNLVFIPVLLTLAVANGGFWADLWGWAPGALGWARELACGLLLVLVGIIGGRVIPFFASRALPRWRALSPTLWERLSLPSLLACLAAPLLPAPAAPAVFLATAAIHLLRLLSFWQPGVAGVPLLWSLYLGYFFLPLGFLLKAGASLHWLAPNLALHAHTVGCLGTMVVAMMSRVSLGHTGRELHPPAAMTVAFLAMPLAACLRSLGPAFWPQHYAHWLACSGVAWSVAFGLFAWHYLPLLIRPRVDGKPG